MYLGGPADGAKSQRELALSRALYKRWQRELRSLHHCPSVSTQCARSAVAKLQLAIQLI